MLDDVREKALANLELLLDFKNIQFKKITETEYDILATWRTDKNFGSVRFNTEKGRGADFAGGSLTEEDYSGLGVGFSRDDFVGFSSQDGQAKLGFDVIGLFQRILGVSDYKDTVKAINAILDEISRQRAITIPSKDAAIRRDNERKLKEAKLKKLAYDLWESCKHHKFENSPAEKYLIGRGITKKEENLRFHPGIKYGPTGEKYPAILFKVQEKIDGPLVAIHRIYLSNDGKKAKLDNPKMALAPIKGTGIWFGKPSSVLALTEGPENALTLLELGYRLVVSSIFGSNLHNLTIPKYVKKLIIFPDVDTAGMKAFERAKAVYSELDIEVEGYLLDKFLLPSSTKQMDLNDLHLM